MQTETTNEHQSTRILRPPASISSCRHLSTVGETSRSLEKGTPSLLSLVFIRVHSWFNEIGSGLEQAFFDGFADRAATRVDMELGVNVSQVCVHGMKAQGKFV